jgi:hypothetical protein
MKAIHLVATLPLITAGCASWFLHGAKLADHDYAKDHPGGYRVVGCAMISDGTPVPPPNTTYHVVTDGAATGLFERSPDGTGSLIENHWQAKDGDHYFVWVKQTGWEMVLPKEGPPKRLVYIGVSEMGQADGAVHPTTDPAVSCTMETL